MHNNLGEFGPILIAGGGWEIAEAISFLMFLSASKI